MKKLTENNNVASYCAENIIFTSRGTPDEIPIDETLIFTAQRSVVKKKATIPSSTASALHDKLLLIIYAYHYLRVDQIVRSLGLSQKSTNYVRSHLKQLVDDNFLYAQFLPRTTPSGKTPIIYTLAAKGIKHLQKQGVEAVSRFSPSEQTRSPLFLEHTLALNSVLIAAAEVEKHVPEIFLAEMRHERVLKHHPIAIPSAKTGDKAKVIPDAWLDFHISPPYGSVGERISIVVELDRGTVDVYPFKRKINALIRFAHGPYQQAFQTDSLTIAFLVTAGEKRKRQILRWVEQEATDMKLPQMQQLFFVAVLQEPIDPLQLFLQPAGHSPGSETAVTLIEKVETGKN